MTCKICGAESGRRDMCKTCEDEVNRMAEKLVGKLYEEVD